MRGSKVCQDAGDPDFDKRWPAMLPCNALPGAQAPDCSLSQDLPESPCAARIAGVRQAPGRTLQMHGDDQASVSGIRLHPIGQATPWDEGFSQVKTPSTIAACLAPGPPSAGASARILRTLAWKALTHALDQLIFEGLPVVRDLKGAADELKALLQGNYTRQHQLQQLAEALERFAHRVADVPGQSWQDLRALSACLGRIGTWLNSVGEQWLTLELLVEQGHAQQPLLDKAANLTGLTRRLLADRQLQTLVGQGVVQQLDQRLASLDQTLAQVRLWQALPDGAGLEDYLQLLAGNPLLGGALADSLQRLGRVLGQVQKGYPDAGTLPEKLAWLLRTLSDPALCATLQPHLEMLAGSQERAGQLLATVQFADRLRRFPVTGSLAEHVLWLLDLLNGHVDDCAALAWLKPFQTTLGAAPAMIHLVNQLLGAQPCGGSRLGLVKALVTPFALPLAGAVAEYALPLFARQWLEELLSFYRQSSPEETWADLALRLGSSLVALARPCVWGALSGDALAADTVRFALALQTHTSWEQTCKWFIVNAPGQALGRQLVYSQCLTGLLLGQAFRACYGQAPVAAEARLRQLARQLKDYELVKSYPALKPLLDLLPLLPLLMDARRHVNVQPGADTWLGWASQWLSALGRSTCCRKSLLEVQQRLSRQLEHWVADALMGVLSALPIGLPGAAAAPTSAMAGGSLSPWTRVTASSAIAGEDRSTLLMGAIGLEGVGLCALGYALWQARQGTPVVAPVEDAETALMGARPRAATAALMAGKVPLLLGVTAMAAGGVLLYRWRCTEAPQARMETHMANAEAPEADFDLPIYTPYVDLIVSEKKRWPETPMVGNASDAAPLCASAVPVKRKREALYGGEQPPAVMTVGGRAPAPADADATLTREQLDFSKYKDSVATKLSQLWSESVAQPGTLALEPEEHRYRHFIHFHQLLIAQVGLILTSLEPLPRNGQAPDSAQRAALTLMAVIVAEADQVLEHIPGAEDARRYLNTWQRDCPWLDEIKNIKRAFNVSDSLSEVYFKQRYAWSYSSGAPVVDHATLTNSERLWRSAIADERFEFRKRIDPFAPQLGFDELPDFFISVFESRVEWLAVEIYNRLSEEPLSAARLLQREVTVEVLAMQKFHLVNMLVDELESYELCRKFKKNERRYRTYSGHRAVFEAKKIALDWVIEQYASEISVLDADDKIIAYARISQDLRVSDEVRSYLHKAASLALQMMTKGRGPAGYHLWNERISIAFDAACERSEYVRRFYADEPQGYRGLQAFKTSDACATWPEYFDQFFQYKEKFADADKRRIAYGLMLSLGLTDYDMSKITVQRVVYAELSIYPDAHPEVKALLISGAHRDPGKKFQNGLGAVTTLPGLITFLLTTDGGMIVVSAVGVKFAVKRFSRQSVQANSTLNKIAEVQTLPYPARVPQLEGKTLIDSLLRPLYPGDMDALLGHTGFPLLRPPAQLKAVPGRNKIIPGVKDPELLSVVDDVIKENLMQWLGLLKHAYQRWDFWSVLPFYKEARDYRADPDHQLDVNALMWDVASLSLSILPVIARLSRVAESALEIAFKTAMQQLGRGISRKVVVQQTLLVLMQNQQFTALGMRGLRYVAYMGAVAVSPLPPELIVTPAVRVSRFIRGASPRTVGATHSQHVIGGVAQWAEMSALGKITAVSVGVNKSIVLRASQFKPGEVIEETRALFQPAGRKQPVIRRAGKAAPYTRSNACTSVTEALYQLGSASVLCTLGRRMKNAGTLIGEGKDFKLYELDETFVLKEYVATDWQERRAVMQKARTNELAFNRLYGQSLGDFARVWPALKTDDPPASVQWRRLPGKTLGQIIRDQDAHAIQRIRAAQEQGPRIDKLLALLRDHGIHLDAVGLDDILHDAQGGTYSVINFDHARVNPYDVGLTDAQVAGIRHKLEQVFNAFTRRTEQLQPEDFDRVSASLNDRQWAALASDRRLYLADVRRTLAGPAALEFEQARSQVRGFNLPGLSGLQSELALTKNYNDFLTTFSAKQRGDLTGLIENTRYYRFVHGLVSAAASYAAILSDDSTRSTIAPQLFLSMQPDVRRDNDGLSTALVLAVAAAVNADNVSHLWLNLYRASVNMDSPHNEIMQALNQLQSFNTSVFLTPQLNAQACEVDVIVRHLEQCTETALFAMATPIHSMMVGVTRDTANGCTFHFYDPVIGLFSYPGTSALRAVLRRTLGTLALGECYAAYPLSGRPGYTLSLISLATLSGELLPVGDPVAGGIRLRTVADLCRRLDDPPVCSRARACAERLSASPACSPFGNDIIAMEAIQEAVFQGRALDGDFYHAALGFELRLREAYKVTSAIGIDVHVALLNKARRQLTGRLFATPAVAASTREENRVVHLNYLAALVEAAHRFRA